MFFENQTYEIILEAHNGCQVVFRHENPEIQNSLTSFGHHSPILSGIINFGNDIGFSDLLFLVDETEALRLTIEVFPDKLSYKEDYQALLSDITSELYGLAFDFLRKTYLPVQISASAPASPVEFFAILCKIFEHFIAVLNRIMAKPHHSLHSEHQRLPVIQATRSDARSIRWLERHPDAAYRSGGKILASELLSVAPCVTYNTPENRFVKALLQNTAKELLQFKKQYQKVYNADEALIVQLDRMIHGIQSRYEAGFLQEAEAALPGEFGSTFVCRMASGYRELYHCYQLLRHGLSLSCGIFSISLKDLSVLYEYWCFIKLNRLLKNRYRLLSQDIIKVNRRGLSFSLREHRSSEVRYLNPANGEIITLCYHPAAQSLPTTGQHPNHILTLRKKGSLIDYQYIFDAKYRMDPAEEGSSYQKLYGTAGPQEEDINALHRYRDAMVFQSGTSPFERTMFGAYVLFPYQNGEEYRRHHFYRSIETVNIGGLPFLPSETKLVSEMLDELISDSPESSFERATLPLGFEERLNKVDWKKRDVLVGTFRSAAQFEVCRENFFYYIPAKRIPDERLPIHYVAMFQTPGVFADKAGIYYYGEVLRTALVKRKSIKEVPMHSNSSPEELYYRFQIREWIPLLKPIMPKESAFVHAFTNLFLLGNAEFVSELLLRSEAEYRFYTELKRRSREASVLEGQTASGFEYHDAVILFDAGQIKILKNNRLIEHCSVEAFSRHPNTVFRMLSERIGL